MKRLFILSLSCTGYPNEFLRVWRSQYVWAQYKISIRLLSLPTAIVGNTHAFVFQAPPCPFTGRCYSGIALRMERNLWSAMLLLDWLGLYTNHCIHCIVRLFRSFSW